MRFIGANNAHCETEVLCDTNISEVLKLKSSELLLIWFESDNNSLEVDNITYHFNTNDIVCLTEFHLVKPIHITQARYIKWDKYFYCIINHDSEVGCKGILFYGAVNLPIIHLNDDQIALVGQVWKALHQEM
jgi:hypothetical protein